LPRSRRASSFPRRTRSPLPPSQSEEFRLLWKEHEVGIRPRDIKRYQHPDVGFLELNCQILLDPETSHSLLVYTAVPGSESYEKLALLSVIGAPSLK
jgi:hypothetical protein